MADKANIEMPRFLLQWMLHPIYAAMEEVSGRETSSDSAELDMYLEVLECIFKAFPEENSREWYRRWSDIQQLSRGSDGGLPSLRESTTTEEAP